MLYSERTAKEILELCIAWLPMLKQGHPQSWRAAFIPCDVKFRYCKSFKGKQANLC